MTSIDPLTDVSLGAESAVFLRTSVQLPCRQVRKMPKTILEAGEGVCVRFGFVRISKTSRSLEVAQQSET